VTGRPAGAAVAALLLAAGAAAAQVTTHPTALPLAGPRSPRPDPAAHRSVLHGVATYIVEDRTVPLVTLSAFIGSGTADGAPGAAAALAAALRTRGPAHLAPPDFHDALRRMTADFRVVAGAEEIEVSLDVPAADATAAAELLVALLRRPDLEGADVAALVAGGVRRSPSEDARGEAGPVLYEGSLDVAVALLHDDLLGDTRYARTLTPEQAAALAIGDVIEFHRRHVVAGNIALAVSGDVDRTAMERILDGLLRGTPSGRRPARPARAPAPAPTPRTAHLYPADKLQAWVVLGHALDPVSAEDEPALRVMNYILGGGHFDARLFIEVRDKRGLANTAGGFPEWRRHGPGTYTLRTYGRPEAIPLLVHILEREVHRIRTERVSDEELRVARGALIHGEFAMDYHDGQATARSLAREWLYEGGHDRSARFAARVAAVTADDVMRAANRYLHPDRFRMVIVGPLDAIAAARRLEDEPPLEAFGLLRRGR
jgi:zinc protease